MGFDIGPDGTCGLYHFYILYTKGFTFMEFVLVGVGAIVKLVRNATFFFILILLLQGGLKLTHFHIDTCA